MVRIFDLFLSDMVLHLLKNQECFFLFLNMTGCHHSFHTFGVRLRWSVWGGGWEETRKRRHWGEFGCWELHPFVCLLIVGEPVVVPECGDRWCRQVPKILGSHFSIKPDFLFASCSYVILCSILSCPGLFVLLLCVCEGLCFYFLSWKMFLLCTV